MIKSYLLLLLTLTRALFFLLLEYYYIPFIIVLGSTYLVFTYLLFKEPHVLLLPNDIIVITALVIIFLLWPVTIIYTKRYDDDASIYFMTCSIIFAILLALSTNLMTLFIFYELITIFTAPLIARKENALKEYLQGLIVPAVCLLLPAILITQEIALHTDFSFDGSLNHMTNKTYIIALFLMFVFGIAKTAIMPMHKWILSAMSAPYPVSALLHSVVVVNSGVLFLLKVILFFGIDILAFAKNYLFLLPAITVIYASIKAFFQTNIKMLLVYSTISQISLSILYAFLLNKSCFDAALLHIINHSISKIILFFIAGYFAKLVDSNQLNHMQGIFRYVPKIISCSFIFASLALAGAPPFIGFFAKEKILHITFIENKPAFIIIALSSFLTFTYLIKMIIIFSGNRIVDIKNINAAALEKPILICFVIIFISGIYGFIY